MQIDSREAQKLVRDAQTNLGSAKLSFEKLIQPTDSFNNIAGGKFFNRNKKILNFAMGII